MANFLDFMPKKVICPICGNFHAYDSNDYKLRAHLSGNILPATIENESIRVKTDETAIFEIKFSLWDDSSNSWIEDTLKFNANYFMAVKEFNALFNVVNLERIGKGYQPFGFIFSEEDFEEIVKDGRYWVVDSETPENRKKKQQYIRRMLKTKEGLQYAFYLLEKYSLS